MTLGELLDRSRAVIRPASDTAVEPRLLTQTVTAIAYDSRQVTPGSVFVGLRGARHDGAAYLAQAISRGAIAVVVESAPGTAASVPVFIAPDTRVALAPLAALLYGSPSDSLLLIGLTGTNGKTTTTYLISAVFDRAGIPCGRIGTVSYRVGADEHPAARTTPEAPEVQRLLREIVDGGMRACAMEVSSHALMLHRVDATRFTAAVFTNLTRDHLDFHADMESYFLAKKRLFEMLPADGVAVTNLDDPRGAAIVAGCGRTVSYGLTRPADVMPAGWRSTLEGLVMEVRTPRGPLHVRSHLVGAPNACNILAAVATATALDVPFADIEHGLADLESVPGRFQVVSGRGDDVTVVVDYAHTDDALRNLLETARPLAKGRIVTVFGCGGDRDRSKRPLMGAVAARLSDLVIVTSDNPRSEDPREIIDDILRGIKPPKDRLPSKLPPPVQRVTPHLVVVDRHVAIERAIREAIAGDLVLVAGKGHEKYQEMGGRVLPFDDVEVAREALTRRRLESHVS